MLLICERLFGRLRVIAPLGRIGFFVPELLSLVRRKESSSSSICRWRAQEYLSSDKLVGEGRAAKGGVLLDTTTEAGSRAERRLHEEEVAWLTTVRQDGQPQSVPVWFLWDGEEFLIYSQPGRQKLRNIDKNPRIDLNLNSNAHGGDVVRVEGMIDIVEDAPPAFEVPEYVEKYQTAIARIGFDPESFARAYSVPLRVTPTRWQVW
jgi:PPOX class probable F420-dependent enzyme